LTKPDLKRCEFKKLGPVRSWEMEEEVLQDKVDDE
jgi:hypothetical protein